MERATRSILYLLCQVLVNLRKRFLCSRDVNAVRVRDIRGDCQDIGILEVVSRESGGGNFPLLAVLDVVDVRRGGILHERAGRMSIGRDVSAKGVVGPENEEGTSTTFLARRRRRVSRRGLRSESSEERRRVQPRRPVRLS